MKTLVMIMPWYGGIPDYFKFFVEGIRSVTFDILLVSDRDFTGLSLPENVKIIRLSLADVRALAARKLGVAVALDTPRKICDFRPMFGRIFEEWTADYRYWGYGDCDLIYGRKLDEFVAHMADLAVDVASMHRYYISGPFALFKNDEKGRGLYELSSDWKTVATTPEQFLFDECGRDVDWDALETGSKSIGEYGRTFESFAFVLHRADAQGRLRYFHEDLITERIANGKPVRKKGRSLFYDGEEILIFHTIRVKFRRFFHVPGDDWTDLDEFEIDHTGFYSPAQVRWRGLIGKCRILSAIVRSLLSNGLPRLWARRRS